MTDTFILFDDRYDISWSFFHNPDWDKVNPVLVGQMVFEGKTYDGPVPYWRGVHWMRGENPPEWFESFNEFPISRETAIRIAPDAFDPTTPLREIVWDDEHTEGLIDGSYPPPIPNRFEGRLELIELSERHQRGLEMFQRFLDAVDRDFILGFSFSKLIRWLETFSNDELADFYLYTRAWHSAEAHRFKKGRLDNREKVHRTLMSAFKIYLGSTPSG